MSLRPRFLGAVRATCATCAACALSLPWWAGTAHAQAGPTRPTFANPMAAPLGLPQGGAAAAHSGPPQAGGMAAGMRATRPAAVHVPRVSSVVVAHAASSSAVIDDRVYRLGDKVPELGTLVAQGKLRPRETVSQGIESAPEAFLGLLKGKNFGKQLVKLI